MSTQAAHLPLVVSAALLVALAAPRAAAGTIHVPADAPSLSAAIALAQDGDEILVANGIWTGPANRDLLVSGKDLVLRSEHGPTTCTIDCQSAARAISLLGCGPETVLQGFTIRHGKVTTGATDGQGLYVSGGAPVLRDCVVDSCGFTYDGPSFSDNGPFGGGLDLVDSNALVEDCSFTSNKGEAGGGVYAIGGSPTLRRCFFRSNSGEAHFEDGIPIGGFWDGSGGALELVNTTQTVIADCVFDHNQSILTSGAIKIAKFGNQRCSGRISHCTIANTTVGDSFGEEETSPGQVIEVSGINTSGLDWQVDHSIIWQNIATNSAIEAPANGFSMSWCDVQGGYTGTGNIKATPLFVNVAGGDLHLVAHSPCIDVGPHGAPHFGGLTDLDHASRLLDGDLDGSMLLDMGAYEFTNVALAVSGQAIPGGSLTLNVSGRAGLLSAVAVGSALAASPTLLDDFGYELVELGQPWSLVAGPATIPATSTMTIPAGVPPGTILYLQPLAWDQTRAAGNFGAPVAVVVN